jgi:hypothetical protein
VTSLGGHVLKKLGDGLMALFGYPQAQENDGERAVRAALAIQRALVDLNARNAVTGAPDLAARIGLESGRVVVDSTGEVYGDAPNVAARVQSSAAPGEIWITRSVHRQIAGLFVAEDKGAHELKGVPEKTQLYRIVRASGGGRRGGSRAPTPLVGRGEELDILTRRWERARRGEGQLSLIVGEPGLGKSRLLPSLLRTEPINPGKRTTTSLNLSATTASSPLIRPSVVDADALTRPARRSIASHSPTALGNRNILGTLLFGKSSSQRPANKRHRRPQASVCLPQRVEKVPGPSNRLLSSPRSAKHGLSSSTFRWLSARFSRWRRTARAPWRRGRRPRAYRPTGLRRPRQHCRHTGEGRFGNAFLGDGFGDGAASGRPGGRAPRPLRATSPSNPPPAIP